MTDKNKDLEYYLSLVYPFLVIEDKMEGGYTIFFPDLPGCVTCVGKKEDIVPMAEDAKRCWLATTLETGQDVPIPSALFSIRKPL